MRTGIFADILVGRKIPIGDDSGGKMNYDQGTYTCASDRYIMQGTSMTGPFGNGILATRMIGGYRYAQIEAEDAVYNTYANEPWSFLTTRSKVLSASNIIANPYGVVDADSLYETDNTNSIHLAYRLGYAITNGVRQSFTLFIKARERTQLRFSNDTNPYTAGILADLSTGIATDVSASPNVVDWSLMQPAGNGWYRIGYGVTATATTAITLYLIIAKETLLTYMGTENNGLYMSGLNVSKRAYSTSFIKSIASSPVTRAKDVLIMSNAVVPAFLKASATPFTTNLIFNNYSSVQRTADGGKKYLFSVDGTSDIECYIGTDNKIYIDQGGVNKFTSTAKTWAMGADPKVSILPDNGSSECRVITSGFATGNGTETGTAFTQQADGIWSIGSKFGTDDQQLDGMIAEFRQGLV